MEQVYDIHVSTWRAVVKPMSDPYRLTLAMAAALSLTGAGMKPDANAAESHVIDANKLLSIDLGNAVTMEFVLIRAGSFMMGSDSGMNDEKHVHKVTFAKPFYLGRFEVTQQQWRAVMGTNPSIFKGPMLPVENVAWVDCQRFIATLKAKLRGRQFALPTEAQWEYACRAGSATKYSYGDDEGKLGEHAWFSRNSDSATHPVGTRKPNDWGLHDMHGNVWEWCADWYGVTYPKGDAYDPQGPSSGDSRVLRGGAWLNTALNLRSTSRYGYSPGSRNRGLGFGFRLLLEAGPVR